MKGSQALPSRHLYPDRSPKDRTSCPGHLLQGIPITGDPPIFVRPEGGVGSCGCKCDQIDILSEQVARLQEDLGRLWCLQKSEQEINMWYHALVWAEQQAFLKSLQGDLRKSSLKLSEFTGL